jgi:energy-coupling factor transporter ATP-binding protein EcfA2
MKIVLLDVKNYRTLEDISLKFPSFYTAICGANDSGKTNVVRAIRSLLKEDTGLPFIFSGYVQEVSVQEDYPKWKTTEPRWIQFKIELMIDKERDAGLYSVIVKQLDLSEPPAPLNLHLTATYRSESAEPEVVVRACETDYAKIQAQEILKKLQSSKSIYVYNSTQLNPREFFGTRSIGGYVREITGQQESLIASMKKSVDKTLAKVSKTQQADFEALLGRLESKYKVGLTLPSIDVGTMPFSIALGDRKMECPLDDWGSGTKNRTHILLTLFRAKQRGEAEASASKVTPVIIVEEPESFLHPSAQAEFGRVLQDLAEEFQVQVIVTTHSPYLLSMDSFGSNILLQRHVIYKQMRQTEQVTVTPEEWMEPFGQALGLQTAELQPWKDLMLSGSDSILLVEGEIDKEYFEMLRKPEHGANQLKLQGNVVSYEGTGNLQNTILLKFVRDRFKKMFVTFDLDAIGQLEKRLLGLGLVKGKDYSPIGVDAAGKRCVEGLLPQMVVTSVYTANPSIAQAALSDVKEEAESARNKLKKLLLDEFKKVAKPGPEYYGQFYAVVKIINKAIG